MKINLKRRVHQFKELAEILSTRYRIGFIKGHYYIKPQEIENIRNELSNPEETIRRKYETSFADAVGKGRAASFASGRMAFYCLMKVLGIGSQDEVVLTGFTCSVMPNAVLRIGARPVYADVNGETFGSDGKSIRKVLTGKTRMIVVQHSFGIPCETDEIVELAKEKGIYLVEDCALTFDSAYNSIRVGNHADAAIFSTDHTKPLNTLIGGILYTNNISLFERIEQYSRDMPELSKDHQQRLFERFLFERRFCLPQCYRRRKILEFVNSRFNNGKHPVFLEQDYGTPREHRSYPYPAKLPSFLALLGIYELGRWEAEKLCRRRMLEKYIDVLEMMNLKKLIPSPYLNKRNDIIPLRFVFVSEYVEKIINLMHRYIETDYIWFRSPVVCRSVPIEKLGYIPGSCENSEKLSKQIINWPCVVPEYWEEKTIQIFFKIMKGDYHEQEEILEEILE